MARHQAASPPVCNIKWSDNEVLERGMAEGSEQAISRSLICLYRCSKLQPKSLPFVSRQKGKEKVCEDVFLSQIRVITPMQLLAKVWFNSPT